MKMHQQQRDVLRNIIPRRKLNNDKVAAVTCPNLGLYAVYRASH